MKTAQIVLTCFFICVFLSVSVSVSQTTSVKVQNFLKVIQAATSLAEVRSAFVKMNFTQSEIDQLKKAILSSPTLTQKMQQLYNQAFALMKPQIDQFKLQALANLNATKSKYALLQQQKEAAAQAALRQAANTTNPCESDTPMIISMSPKIEPGILFQVLGKGFGKTPGTIFVNLGGNNYYANIDYWGQCYVGGRLMPEISGLRATNYVPLILRTAGGKETTKTTSFQPILEFNDLWNEGSLNGLTGNKDWILNNFQLKNDWFVYSRDLIHYKVGPYPDEAGQPDGHVEITYASDLNVPNGSARTDVHAGCNLFDNAVYWALDTCICGPKGLPYK